MFRRGKKPSREIEEFTYYLEENLYKLQTELQSGNYQHGPYRKFTVTDNKRREILVAGIKDRVVHRLIYEYLVALYEKTFIFDVWSCRKNKGLSGAIERTQYFLKKYPTCFVWRSDVKKFFDNVNQQKLLDILSLKISEKQATYLLKEMILSHSAVAERERERERERETFGRAKKGIPIGNLTSQIFANIYLNELDRYIKMRIKPKAYLRYGDDFIVISDNLENLKVIRETTTQFLKDDLDLIINQKNDIIVKAKWGLRFLGVRIFPAGRKLNKRNWKRVFNNMSRKNISSYHGLVKKHSSKKRIKYFDWRAGGEVTEIL